MLTLLIPINFNDYPLEEIDAILHFTSQSHIKASVIFVYTDSQFVMNSSSSLINVDDIIQQRMKTLIQFETKRVERSYQNLTFLFRTINGLSTKRVSSYAKEHNADLIIYINRKKRGGKTIIVPKLEALLDEEIDTSTLIIPEDCLLTKMSEFSFIRNVDNRKWELDTQRDVGRIWDFLSVPKEIPTVTDLSIPVTVEKAFSTTVFKLSPRAFNQTDLSQFFSRINQHPVCFI